MKKITFTSFILILLLSACKKQHNLPEPEIKDPHFYVKCDMAGMPLNIEAGNEGYYMNSSWYHHDTDNVYVYKGNFEKLTGSGYQVTILINDYKPSSTNAQMNADSALRPGGHLYNDQNISGLKQNISFKPVKVVNDNAAYSWTVTDGVNAARYYGGLGTNGYSISPSFEVGKTYSVSLGYDNGVGTCESSLTSVFKAGSKLHTTITAKRDMSNPEFKYEFSYSQPYPTSYACKWYFMADNSSATTPTLSKIFQPGTSLVKLRLTDLVSGDSCISYYQLHAVNGTPCDANYQATFLPVQNNRLYSSVTIIVTDPNGVVYSSKGLVQPSSSNFDILTLEDYAPNDQGQRTKRLKVKFNCLVKNGNNEIKLDNGEAIIAVAYK